MRRIYFWFLFTINAFIFISNSSFAIPKLRVVCLGDDIIFDNGLADMGRNFFHSRLQSIVGKRYEVMSFAVRDAKIISSGLNSYLSTNEFKEAIASNPNIVFIELGTNDGKESDSILLKQFNNGYSPIIRQFKKLPSAPSIILVLPISVFSNGSERKLSETQPVIPSHRLLNYRAYNFSKENVRHH